MTGREGRDAVKLNRAERDLLARAVVYTRRSAFTDPERIELVRLVGRLSERWDRTQGAFNLLPVRVKRAERAKPATVRAPRDQQ